MTVLQVVALALVAVSGTLVVLSRDPLRQAMVVGIFGLSLAALFLVFQAPDVALSQIVVGSVALPALILLTLAKLRELEREEEEDEE
jgi:energy-converting hydrogenase B subunit D